MSDIEQNRNWSRLHIRNFTVFRDVEFEFVPGINVLVGGNATGKTHLMKLLYAMQKALVEPRHDIAQKLYGIFQPEDLFDLVFRAARTKLATVTADWNNTACMFTISPTFTTSPDRFAGSIGRSHFEQAEYHSPVYIPVKDMLAHSVGFLSLYDQRNIDFDETHRDILSLAFTPALREASLGDSQPLLRLIEQKLEGRVEVSGERFYVTSKNGRFEMHLVAEGWRKLGLLYQLIANGSINNKSVLYWDEPEANLNPSLMDEVVGVLLELSRRGTQVFLATHHYIILKELELQRQEHDAVRMFAMARKPDGSVAVHPASTYIELKPNLIAEQFERIYDMEVDRALRS